MRELALITTGLVFWIAATALGVKSFDAFMVAALMAVIAAALYLFGPQVRQLLGRPEKP
jgi:hypothetical protein